MSKAVISPNELEKITLSSLIKIDNFLDELINDFSVLCCQIKLPSLLEQQKFYCQIILLMN